MPVALYNNATVEIYREQWGVCKFCIEGVFGGEVNYVWSFQVFLCTW